MAPSDAPRRIEPVPLPAPPGDVPWRATRYPGVFWHPLAAAVDENAQVEGADGGDAVVLIRMDPGRGYPPHRHVGIEDVLVLQGGYRDDRGEHLAGSYLRYPPGSIHAPVATGDADRAPGADNPSCILFAIARGGVQNLEAPGEG